MPELTYSIRNGISCWSGGKGPPLLFLHAAGAGADSLLRIAEPYTGTRQVMVPNFPGYGDTASNTEAEAIAERLAVVQALVSEHESPVDVVGHSMGAFIALQAAQRWPDRLARLVAIEPVAFGTIATADPIDQAALAIDGEAARALVSRYDAGDREGGIGAFITLWNGTPWKDLTASVRSALLSLGPTLRREVPAVSFDRTPAAAYAPLRRRLCLIVGNRSPVPAERIVLRIAEAIEGARIVRIDGAGHMGLVQQPSLFQPLIHDFLSTSEEVHG
jgi:pimeloyl-ACP methyl ester carboxylesterase